MDLPASCSVRASFHRKPLLQLPSLPQRTVSYHSNLLKCHSGTTSELQTGTSSSPSVPTHKVTVHDRQRGVIHEFFARGCCTSCAVCVKSGQIRQPKALGISAELKSKGYALLCVGFPTSDLEVETQDEDEVACIAAIFKYVGFSWEDILPEDLLDDYALELAMGDE